MFQKALNEKVRETFNGALGQLKGVDKMLDENRCCFEVSNVLKAVDASLKIIINEQLPHLQKDQIRSLLFYLLADQSQSKELRKYLENTKYSLDETEPEQLPKIWHKLKKIKDKTTS